MIAKRLKTSALAAMVMSLSACAGMNGQFGCNTKGTDSCTPIPEVDHGNYLKANGRVSEVNINPEAGGYRAPTPLPGEPVRKSDSIQRVWIAPFEDTEGNYHEPSFVYFVAKKASWIGVGAKEITDTDEDS